MKMKATVPKCLTGSNHGIIAQPNKKLLEKMRHRHTWFSVLISIVFILFFNSLAFGMLRVHTVVRGIQDPLLSNVISRLKLSQQKKDGKFTPDLIKAYYQQAPTHIKEALKPFGYFKARVQSRLKRTKDLWQAEFNVALGKPVIITNITARIIGPGNKDPELQRILRKMPLRKGLVFTSKAYNATLQRLYEAANNRGYLKARMKEHKIFLNLKRNTAKIIITLNTGPRYRFGPVIFKQNAYDKSYLRRYIPFKQGEYFSRKKLQDFEQGLTNSNLFQSVVVTPETKKAKQLTVPIKTQLIARKRRQYSFGAGYGTDTGFRGSIGMNLWRVNRKGDRFQSLLRLSQKQNTAFASYIIPGRNPITDQFNITGSIEQEDVTSGKGINQQISLNDIRMIHGWQQTLSLGYLHERYNFTGEPKQTARLLIPSASWLRVKSNDNLRPSKGYRINLNLRGSFEKAISTTRFFQAQASGKIMEPLWPSSRLLLRGEVGYLDIKNINDLPLSLQFYAGGAQSIRGYSFKSLTQGRTLLVGSVELRQRIYKNLYAVGFYDVGNVGENFKGKYKQGVGTGIAWQTPVGTLELTVARALSLPDKPWRVQFSMGPDL